MEAMGAKASPLPLPPQYLYSSQIHVRHCHPKPKKAITSISIYTIFGSAMLKITVTIKPEACQLTKREQILQRGYVAAWMESTSAAKDDQKVTRLVYAGLPSFFLR